MHTAGKVLLILGGIITAIGIGITVMGAHQQTSTQSEERNSRHSGSLYQFL